MQNPYVNRPDTGAKGARRIDWEKIEGDFRAGVKTLRQIASEHGITEGYVRKRANAEGWRRDLTDKIKTELQVQLVTNAAGSAYMAAEAADAPRPKLSEREIIAEVAATQAEIIGRHRASVAKLNAVKAGLVDQLDEYAADPTQLTTSVAVLEKLAAVTERLIKLERQAFNIDDEREIGEGQRVVRIERVIFDPQNTDSAGIPAAVAAG